MKLIFNLFQIVLHTLDDSLGFFEHISKDLQLEKINTGMPFDISFISSNLDINREPVVNNCLGGCGLKYSGYNRYFQKILFTRLEKLDYSPRKREDLNMKDFKIILP